MSCSLIVRRCVSNAVSKIKTLTVGQEVVITRTITKEDIDRFSELSGDKNPIHSNDYQEKALVHGAFLNSLVSAVIGMKLPGPGTLVVQQTLNFPNKCYVGDTVRVKVKLVEDRKIIKVEFSCDVKDTNATVLFGTAKLVLPKS